MKKLIITTFAMMFVLLASAQTTLDDIYMKYRGKNGFTSLSMGNDLLKFAAALDPSDEELQQLSDKFRGIKLLVADDFSQELLDEFKAVIEAENYLNIMEVVEGDGVVRFYAKAGKKDYMSFAMIVTEPNGGQVMMSIDGEFTTDDLVKLGQGRSDGDYLSLLRKLEKSK